MKWELTWEHDEKLNGILEYPIFRQTQLDTKKQEEQVFQWSNDAAWNSIVLWDKVPKIVFAKFQHCWFRSKELGFMVDISRLNILMGFRVLYSV